MFEHEPIDIGYKDLECETADTGRRYVTPTGDSYPSITTVLGELSKDSIMKWRKRVGEEEANRISHRAASRGTAVHDLLEKYVNNEEIPKDTLPHIYNSYLKMKPILDARVSKVYAQEAPLYSDYLQIAGRVDLVGMWDGVPSIIDYKTSRKKKKKEWCEGYFMQCAFYALAWEERTGMAIPNIVVAMDVDNEDPLIFVEHRDNWIDKLKNAIEFYHYRKSGTA
jgi:hypothetical protein